ncbi:MAG: M16 family metallopeptidase [Nitriliruptoraceae bacterium]
MSEQHTRLTSGVRVVSEAMPSVRSVALGLWFAVGSRDEHPAEAGCSHFLEHLLFKGTGRRSARDIAEAFDAVGGELNAFTDKEVTCFHARVRDTDLALALDVLADMVTDARNRPEDVEAERQVVLAELDALQDAPDELVHTEFAHAVLGEHPLAAETLGSPTSIRSLDRDTIHAYYLDRYRPEQLVVAAAGNVHHEQLVALVEELVGDLTRPGSGPDGRTPAAAYARGQVRIRHRPSEQAHVVLGGGGLDHHDEDRFALKVLDTVLGGGMSSRLFQGIREDRGLAYSTYSYAASYTDAGLVGAYVGTAPRHVEQVLTLLHTELTRLAEDVTPAEVERAKGMLTGSIVLGLEDPASRMARLGRRLVTGAPAIGVDEALARIEAVGVGAVRAVAARLHAGPHDLAVVGPFDEDAGERLASAIV